jgi:hypothetical protein
MSAGPIGLIAGRGVTFGGLAHVFFCAVNRPTATVPPAANKVCYSNLRHRRLCNSARFHCAHENAVAHKIEPWPRWICHAIHR